MTNYCSECELSLAGLRSGAKTCSDVCRSRRRRRLRDRRSDYRRTYGKTGRPNASEPAWLRRWRTGLKAKYGLTLADYYRLLEDQGFCCASCGDELDLGAHTNVDHCHDTGRVRGVLCSHCNLALGLLKDNPERAERLLGYALRTQGDA